MFVSKRVFQVFSALTSIAVVVAIALAAAQGEEPAFRLVIKGPTAFPTGLPALVSLEISNAGNSSATYWSGGPGPYPAAREFSATLTDAKGKPISVRLFNYQYDKGSGTNRPIEPGKTIAVPILVTATPSATGGVVGTGGDSSLNEFERAAHFADEDRQLPAGEYRLRIQTERVSYRDGKTEKVVWPQAVSAEFRMAVREDAALRIRYESELAGEALRANWCVMVLLRNTKMPHALEGVESGLSADDFVTQRNAGWTLEEIEPRLWPADIDEPLFRGLQKLRGRTLGPWDFQAVDALTRLAQKRGTDRVLAGLIALAQSDSNSYLRSRAVRAIATFHQPSAVEALRRAASDEDSDVRSAATPSPPPARNEERGVK